jgi:putative aminopeptidase FrvX
MIFVGHVAAHPPADGITGGSSVIEQKLGSGVLIGTTSAEGGAADFAGELKSLAETKHIPVTAISANLPRIAGYAPGAEYPKRTVEIGVPTLWVETPAEMVNRKDAASLFGVLATYAGVDSNQEIKLEYSAYEHFPGTIAELVTTYGASGHEAAVREKVKELLPEWARKRTQTDDAGNLILHLGDEKPSGKTPGLAFVAHMDEIGYEVKKIADDGRVELAVVGGGYPQYFLGHTALLHKSDGSITGAAMELPSGWDKPGFEWPQSPRTIDDPARAYVGTTSREETEKLGIKAGDWLTIEKAYRPMIGTRAIGRSFDDRVGCTTLINAVKALGPDLPGRNVTFIWSTQEEVGLKGAAVAAAHMFKDGKAPDFVFAIDTFVSNDSPLEAKRFGNAELGKGFVVRAVDNSNIIPLADAERVVKLARRNKIPAQYGVTGGGNDGAVFTRFGGVDVAMGWPLRYAHSPAEVIDTRDMDGLARIVAIIARSW